MEDKRKRLVVGIVFVLLAILLLYWARILLIPVLSGIFLTYLLLPGVKGLEKKGIAGSTAVLLLCLWLLIAVFLAIYFVLPKFFIELDRLLVQLPRLLGICGSACHNLLLNLEGTLGISGLAAELTNTGSVLLGQIQGSLMSMLASALAAVPQLLQKATLLILAPFVAYYLLKDRELFLQRFCALLPPGGREIFLPLLRAVNDLLRAFIQGYSLVALLVGLAFFVLLALLGVDYALTLGIIMAFGELIPYFGPFLGMIPAVILAILSGGDTLVKTLLAFVLVQQLESLVLSPKIMGNTLALHPLAVMLAVLLGGYWFGVWGLVFAVPICAVLKLTILRLYRHDTAVNEN